MFYMHDSAGWGWGWWVLMTIGMVALWALIIYAIVWLVRAPSADQDQQAPPESPEQILKRRLAQGEISVEEYERLHSVVDSQSGGPSSAAERRSAA